MDGPGVLWECVWHFVETVWVVGLFSAFDHSFDLWVVWWWHELPVVQIKSFFLRKATKCFVHFSLSRWNIFWSASWGYKTAGLYLIHHEWESVELSKRFWLKDDSKFSVDDLRVTATWEKNWIKFTCEQVVDALDFFKVLWISNWLWQFWEDPAAWWAPEHGWLTVVFAGGDEIVFDDTYKNQNYFFWVTVFFYENSRF